MGLGVFMKNNVIYKVLNISNVLKKLALSDKEKLFILFKKYNTIDRLEFYIADCEYKIVLLAKNAHEQLIYEFPFTIINILQFKGFINDKSIVPTQYTVDDDEEIIVDEKGTFFSIVNTPKIDEYVVMKNGKCRAKIHIMDTPKNMRNLSGYGSTPRAAIRDLMEHINEHFYSYLFLEQEDYSPINMYLKNIENIDTKKRVFKNLDSTVKSIRKTEELDMEDEI